MGRSLGYSTPDVSVVAHSRLPIITGHVGALSLLCSATAVSVLPCGARPKERLWEHASLVLSIAGHCGSLRPLQSAQS